MVESPTMTREVFARGTKYGEPWQILIKFAMGRKNTWRSREDARQWTSEQLPWSAWDPRCLDLFAV